MGRGGQAKDLAVVIKEETTTLEEGPLKKQKEICGQQTCSPRPCSHSCQACRSWSPETCECTALLPCTLACEEWKTGEETTKVERAQAMDNTLREKTAIPSPPP